MSHSHSILACYLSYKVKEISLKIKNILTKFKEKRTKQCGHIHTQCVMNCLLHGTLFRLKVQKFMGLSVEAHVQKRTI
jgi:hypothetical protein